MFVIPTERILKRALMMSIAGTRGGITRLQILLTLMKKPHNINKLSRLLGLDYKTVEYHMRVLEKSGFVSSQKKKYASEYMLSTLLKANKHILTELGKTR